MIKLSSFKELFKAAGLPGYLFFFSNILYFFVTRRRSLDDYSAIDSSAFIQIIYIFSVFLIGLIILYKNPEKRKFLFSTPQVYLLLFVFICFFSMIWTTDVFVTGFRAFESLTYLLLISLITYNLTEKLHYQDIIEWSFLWIIWEIFWSIATAVKLGGFGYLIWPFRAARLSVPMFFFFALLLEKRIVFRYIILIFSILMISNKVYFGIAFGLAGFLFGENKYKAWLILLFFLILFVLAFINPEELLKDTLFYGRESVSMASTSGRDKVWAVAWEAFLQKPYGGYGFVSGESSILYNKFNGAISTHNFLFSGLLGTGIAGTIFLILYFVDAFLKASSKYFPKNRIRPAMVATLIMSLVVSSTAPGIGGRVYGSWIPVVLVIALISGLQYQFKILTKIKRIQNYKSL